MRMYAYRTDERRTDRQKKKKKSNRDTNRAYVNEN